MTTFTNITPSPASYTCNVGTPVETTEVAHPNSILDENGIPILDEFAEQILDEA